MRSRLGWSLRWAVVAMLAASTALVTGCATTQQAIERVKTAGSRFDPIEPVNRVIYTFNDRVDKAVVKPVAEGYKAILPTQVRYCISNVFGNIADVPTALNNFLQGKIKEGGSDMCRVGVNTTVGLLGCFDIASKWGFEKHNEDFGQTLGRWGIQTGPYIVLPLLGPSTLRDASALFLVDSRTDPLRYVNDIPVRNISYGVRLVDRRAQLLDTTNFLEDAALDPYVFVRDAYLARRRSLVNDGNTRPADDAPGGDATQPTSGPKPADDGPSKQ
ncbi:MAG: MlaA family lipoprotein [Burkholderiaceae bacterium]